jgi:ring-1,2-phenylacetyl-CoA epoxidase subunit PaaE
MIHFHPLRIKNIERQTNECVSITFDVPASLHQQFAFTQGQNITIKKTIDGEELRRSYSICSSPLDNELCIAVKEMAGGKFSTWANKKLKKGDVLDVLPPTGKFNTQLHITNKKNYLAFAAGSGITPLLSIIKTTFATEPDSTFTLVYGNQNTDSIIFKDALDALKNKYVQRFSLYHVLSRQFTDAPINQGRIDVEKCEHFFDKLIDVNFIDEFFICGPEEMIFTIGNLLQQKGINKTHIHFELFTTPGQKTIAASNNTNTLKESAPTAQVSIKLDGRTFNMQLAYNGKPILDAALQQGAQLPYACKGGVCSTCRARLLTGLVEMDINYALEEDELKAGYILTCQSHPRSKKVEIDFDAS